MKIKKSLLLPLLLIINCNTYCQNFVGNWQGKLLIQGSELPIVFHITKIKNQYTATMDSPKQKVFGITVNQVRIVEKVLKIELPGMGIVYDATWQNDSLIGNFSQNGMIQPLDMERMTSAVFEGPKRPQEPKPKFNYTIKEITFNNPSAKINLAGTLTLPKGKGPFPAVVLVSGSGPQDRNEEILGHKPFWVIADYLTRNGIAVLRYDDRGVAKSEGNFKIATSADFATDAQAAISFLRKQKNIDSEKIGIAGHSEGGMIAEMVAAEDKKLGFIILLAAPGMNIDELMIVQNATILKAQGATEKDIEATRQLDKSIYQTLIDEPDDFEADKKLVKLLKSNLKTSDLSDNQIKTNIKELTSPWFRYFISFSPEQFLSKIQIPVLAINGDKDQQVESTGNLGKIETVLKTNGNNKVEIHEMPDMNHLFQTTTTGNISEYGDLEETFNPQVMRIMKDWILQLK